MKDALTVQRVALLHPKWIPDVTNFINDLEAFTGRVWRVVQGGRTFAEQQALWEQGRTKPGHIVTYSKAGQSYHCYWLAIDAVPFMADSVLNLDWHFDYKTIKPIADKYGIQMGLFFPTPDSDHFEQKYGLTWEQMLEKYNAGDFIPGTHFINI